MTAEDKHVVIIGGGDTGADCLGTAHRQFAKNIVQLELLPRPPERRSRTNPWPDWPGIFRTSSAHEEGGKRDYNIMTKRFVGSEGNVTHLECVRVDWVFEDGQRPRMVEIPGSEFTIPADIVFLAMGFVHPQHEGLLDDLEVEYDPLATSKQVLTWRAASTRSLRVATCSADNPSSSTPSQTVGNALETLIFTYQGNHRFLRCAGMPVPRSLPTPKLTVTHHYATPVQIRTLTR